MATTDDPVRKGIDALARFFVGQGTLADTLTEVSQLACDALGADMAGITMLVDGRVATGVFTDPTVPELDTTQYDTGQGPCLDAFRHQITYRIADTATEDRWPAFATDAAAHGIRTTLSLPLTRTDEPLGALNLYARSLGAFAGDIGPAELLASQCAIVLANAAAYQESRELNENLRQALTSRSTIDQAVGIVMAGGGRNPDQAFQLLVRASQRENRKLRDVATDIVVAAERRSPPAG